jgi:gamma-carbonic anhydrase
VIVSFEGKSPALADKVFVAADALVLGDVTVGAESSIWYGTVLRGDVHSIQVGRRTNIQDRCVVHVTSGAHPAWIGDSVTVGHAAVVHGCRVGHQCLVGIGAILLDGVEVGEGSVVAAGSLLPPGRSYPGGSLIIGSPAEVKRSVSADERAWILRSADHYVALADRHASLLRPPQL